MIHFNSPYVPEKIEKIFSEVFAKKKFCGDGDFTKACHKILEEYNGSQKALLTTSCTHAIEMSALLCEIKEGDEVIMPSFTFVSTANAFVLRGAKIIFVDIRPDTMNLDESLIEQAISEKTKAIIPVHYAGVACEMDAILALAKKHDVKVIEDAAQGIGAYYKGRALGSIGDFGTLSFHETKNIHCGEGGALLINRPEYAERAEVIREKGTNRSKFIKGMVDKYTWTDIGSSYLPGELNAAMLLLQLQQIDVISKKRLASWNLYKKLLRPLERQGQITLPTVPDHCTHNGHIFYIKCKDIAERSDLIGYLKSNEIQSVFHYIPLHSSPAGLRFGKFVGEEKYTTLESERLLRLPLYFDLTETEVIRVCQCIENFYLKKIK